MCLCFQDTFQDYQEMFIQFGYVVLFSSAFPLAAMCALINNIIEIRSDAFKLCTGLQRPFGMRVESIGQWQVSRDTGATRELGSICRTRFGSLLTISFISHRQRWKSWV